MWGVPIYSWFGHIVYDILTQADIASTMKNAHVFIDVDLTLVDSNGKL
jgi:hypothetical protein